MKVSYHEFIDLKNEFLRDPDPVLCFALVFDKKFPGLSKEQLSKLKLAKDVTHARVMLDAMVEWV